MEMVSTAKTIEAATAAAGPGASLATDNEIDRVTLRNFVKGIRTASKANIVPFALIGLCSLSLANPWTLMALVALSAGVIAIMGRVAGKIGEGLARGRPEKAIRQYEILSVVSGALWGAKMQPVAGTLASSLESMFVCVLIVASAIITCVVCADQRRFLFAFLVGFETVLVSICLWNIESLGFVPLIATLSLIPVGLTLAHVVREQNRLIVRTQLENKILADQLCVALQKAEYVANRDSLTGLLNRRAFEQAAEEMKKLGGRKAKLAIILIDLDHFKAINDTYGHPMGDEVLKSTANLIQSVTGPRSLIGRGDGAVARWGGEEFILMMSNCPMDHAIETAELIRTKLLSERAPHWSDEMSVSGSFGIVSWDHGVSLHAAISMADQAMYSAKISGRNRSCVYHEDGCVSVDVPAQLSGHVETALN